MKKYYLTVSKKDFFYEYGSFSNTDDLNAKIKELKAQKIIKKNADYYIVEFDFEKGEQ